MGDGDHAVGVTVITRSIGSVSTPGVVARVYGWGVVSDAEAGCAAEAESEDICAMRVSPATSEW